MQYAPRFINNIIYKPWVCTVMRHAIYLHLHSEYSDIVYHIIYLKVLQQQLITAIFSVIDRYSIIKPCRVYWRTTFLVVLLIWVWYIIYYYTMINLISVTVLFCIVLLPLQYYKYTIEMRYLHTKISIVGIVGSRQYQPVLNIDFKKCRSSVKSLLIVPIRIQPWYLFPCCAV